MPGGHREGLRRIRTFPQLAEFLRDELGWPVDADSVIHHGGPDSSACGRLGYLGIFS